MQLQILFNIETNSPYMSYWVTVTGNYLLLHIMACLELLNQKNQFCPLQIDPQTYDNSLGR